MPAYLGQPRQARLGSVEKCRRKKPALPGRFCAHRRENHQRIYPLHPRMSAQIKLQLAPEAERIVRNLQTMPTDMVAAVARAMDQGNQLAVSQIQRFHLTGKGPFPVEEHKLGRVSGLLRESVSASPAVVQDTKVRSSIGSTVVYAAIHEFGGLQYRATKEKKVRLHVDARGALVRQLKHSNLAVFARADHKR